MFVLCKIDHNSSSVIPALNSFRILLTPISATSNAAFMHFSSSADLITLACSNINFASITSIPILFKADTAGPFKTSIAIFLLLK